MPESIKQPLENRVWYDYPGQSISPTRFGSSSTPLHIGRVLDNGATQLQTFEYNATGNVTQATDPVSRQIGYTYSGNGIDVTSITNTTGGVSQVLASITYNAQHEPLAVTGANGATTQYQYNAAGQPVKIIDALGNATNHAYSNGYLTNIQGPVKGAQYTFTYDGFGRIASATDPAGSTVSYAYDAADRPTSATYPDGTSARLTYKLLDLSSKTDRLGQTTNLVHDADRELVSSTDPFGQITQFGYNPDGKLISIIDPNNHTTLFTLDDEGRVITKTYADGSTQSTAYENSIGLVSSQTDALSQTTQYSYNTDNTLASIAYSGAVNATAGVSYTYDPAYARLTSMTDGIGTTTYSYYPVSSSPQLGANQLETVTSPIAGTSNGTDTMTNTYDALTANRLLSAVVSNAAGTTTQSFGYSYDPGSNLTALTANGVTQSPAYTSTNEISSGTYDANGNPTALGSAQYSWDAANRVVTFVSGTNQSNFTYDGQSRLVRIVDMQNGVVVADKAYFWCGTMRCLEHDNTQKGSPVSKQYFDQGVIADDTAYYYITDRLGSVRQLIDVLGNVQAQYDYDPYGNPTTVSGSVTSDVGYSGYFHHAASGLDFALYRAYDSTHARWLNRDPIGEVGNLNLYAYVEGNPLTQTDPTGTISILNDPLVNDALIYGSQKLIDFTEDNMLTIELNELFNNPAVVAGIKGAIGGIGAGCTIAAPAYSLGPEVGLPANIVLSSELGYLGYLTEFAKTANKLQTPIPSGERSSAPNAPSVN